MDKISFLWIIGILVLLSACFKDKGSESKAPELVIGSQFTVTDITGTYDSFIQININYSDQDGDIGLRDSDTMGDFKWGAPYFYNLFCYFQTLRNGEWVSVLNPFDTLQKIQFHERLPYVTPQVRDKRLTGTVQLFIPARPNGLRLDTVVFHLEMVDRALNKSNLCRSKEFILKHP
jgi:hypothetical protein